MAPYFGLSKDIAHRIRKIAGHVAGYRKGALLGKGIPLTSLAG